MSTRLTPFEQSLLGDLHAYAARRQRRRARLRGASGATVGGGVVAAALAATLAFIPTAAYAVNEEADGTITVTIRELTDEEGLERELRAFGISAEVDYSAPVPASSGDGTDPEQADGTASRIESSERTTTAEANTAPASEPSSTCDLPSSLIPSLERTQESVAITLPRGWTELDETLRIHTTGDDNFDGLSVGTGSTCVINVASTR